MVDRICMLRQTELGLGKQIYKFNKVLGSLATFMNKKIACVAILLIEYSCQFGFDFRLHFQFSDCLKIFLWDQYWRVLTLTLHDTWIADVCLHGQMENITLNYDIRWLYIENYWNVIRDKKSMIEIRI